MKHDPAIHSPKFPASVQPARPGVYYRVGDQRSSVSPADGFSFFDGESWGFGGHKIVYGAALSSGPSLYQNSAFHWFGLKEKE